MWKCCSITAGCGISHWFGCLVLTIWFPECSFLKLNCTIVILLSSCFWVFFSDVTKIIWTLFWFGVIFFINSNSIKYSHIFLLFVIFTLSLDIQSLVFYVHVFRFTIHHIESNPVQLYSNAMPIKAFWFVSHYCKWTFLAVSDHLVCCMFYVSIAMMLWCFYVSVAMMLCFLFLLFCLPPWNALTWHVGHSLCAFSPPRPHGCCVRSRIFFMVLPPPTSDTVVPVTVWWL